jgi:hypothetical protein
MTSRDKDRRRPAPRRSTGYFTRHAIVGFILTGLATWSLAPGGIIELGKKGKNTRSSEFSVIVEGDTFRDPAHVAGDSAEVLLDRICADINTNSGGDYVARKCNGLAAANCPVDPNAYCDLPPDVNLNALRIKAKVGLAEVEVRSLKVIAEDDLGAGDGIGTAGVRFGLESGFPNFKLRALDIDPNKAGPLTLKITVADGSTDTISFTTTADGDLDDDMEKLKQDLDTAGYNVTPKGAKARGEITVHKKSGKKITRLVYTHGDTGVSRTVVSGGIPGHVPTLSTVGIVVLVLLLGVTAMIIIHRRRAAGVPST